MHLTDHINFAAYCDRTVNLPTTGPKRDPLARRLKQQPIDFILTHFSLTGHPTPKPTQAFLQKSVLSDAESPAHKHRQS